MFHPKKMIIIQKYFSAKADFFSLIFSNNIGKQFTIQLSNTLVIFSTRDVVPRHCGGKDEQIGLLEKYIFQSYKDSLTFFNKIKITFLLSLISACERFFIPTQPNFNGTYLFNNNALASVPLSIISILVIQPIVLYPFLSICLAICNT